MVNSKNNVVFSVPLAVRQNARLGLQLRRKFNRGNRNNFIAQKLITGNIDYATLVEILKYFKEHANDANVKTVKGEWNTTKNPSDLYVDWLLHGGTQGVKFALGYVKEFSHQLSK